MWERGVEYGTLPKTLSSATDDALQAAMYTSSDGDDVREAIVSLHNWSKMNYEMIIFRFHHSQY
jgi:hypothetical protein